jgi:MFS family permease
VVQIPAVVFGLIAGGLTVRWNRSARQIPEFQHAWVVAVFFVPQLLAFYMPVTRNHMPTPVVAACLIISQVGLLLFCVFNKQLPGIPILATGLFLNLLVISANGGFMPLSTATAAQLIPEQVLKSLTSVVASASAAKISCLFLKLSFSPGFPTGLYHQIGSPTGSPSVSEMY